MRYIFIYELEILKSFCFKFGMNEMVSGNMGGALVDYFKDKLSQNDPELDEEVAKSIGQVTFYMRDELEVQLDLVPLVNFPTFLSNVGGLLGRGCQSFCHDIISMIFKSIKNQMDEITQKVFISTIVIRLG